LRADRTRDERLGAVADLIDGRYRLAGLGAAAVFRACVILLLLTSCAGVAPYQRSNPPQASSPLVTSNVRAIFAQVKMPGTPQISGIFPAHPISPGDWLVCLRSSDTADRVRYALYFTGYTLVQVQRAVVVDRCDERSYSPLMADIPTGPAPTGQPIAIGRTAVTLERPIKKERSTPPATPRGGRNED
jgi:hypothetical protein